MEMLSVSSCAVKEGKTTPPKHFTEDTLLSAMETAGKEDMPEDAERRGLGTPATRAAVIEKLVATGFAERKKAKKSVRLVPTEAGVSLITVLPEQLQSPLLTAEWEHRLKEIECGELDADEFLEMAMEDDYGMIDGVINNGPKQTVAEPEEQAKSGKPVSLMELAQAARREQAQAARQEKKPSVLAKLCPPVNEPKKTARSKRAERELL